jgi:hypothetical protein
MVSFVFFVEDNVVLIFLIVIINKIVSQTNHLYYSHA